MSLWTSLVLTIVLAWCLTVTHAPTTSAGCHLDPLALQVNLDRAGFSPGVIDGRAGALTTRALTAFARTRGIAGPQANCAAWRALRESNIESLVRYKIMAGDVAGPFVPAIPNDLMEQANLPALSYTSPLEALSERFHTTPEFLSRLNPHARFEEGREIAAPNIGESDPKAVHAGKDSPEVSVVVKKATSELEVQNRNGETVFYAPVTVGSEHDPLPLGTWRVTRVLFNPPFFYNPDLFWDSDPAHAKAKIPPGPNNPVGVVWIDISKENYGLHGTPEPARIGYASSHGCVRLTNWDALKVAELVKPGTRVIFE
jgi:lipoprotein-anchoring transpeptidase ErfK/SrfK